MKQPVGAHAEARPQRCPRPERRTHRHAASGPDAASHRRCVGRRLRPATARPPVLTCRGQHPFAPGDRAQRQPPQPAPHRPDRRVEKNAVTHARVVGIEPAVRSPGLRSPGRSRLAPRHPRRRQQRVRTGQQHHLVHCVIDPRAGRPRSRPPDQNQPAQPGTFALRKRA